MRLGLKEENTGLIKYILFGNFWSFLLILSGIVDIVLGILFLTGIISVKGGSSFLVFIICLITGLVYFLGGLSIAIIQRKKLSQKQ